MEVLATHNPALHAHLESLELKIALYISPHVLNQISNTRGKNMIPKYLIDKVRSARHF